ncbi:PqiB family protein [Achromobacter aegrifaciens]|uniref:Paraquat-inducible protein B n=1 Tax=Achromobacter aegrifaciens TaxID=1287736 RepID=A0AAD2IUI1_ACHAE|nr:MlaD family protein [Achromobacter aegrifaciens]CUI34260.1 paraquat-inducible protein B [Achromobacter aegrifaciens]
MNDLSRALHGPGAPTVVARKKWRLSLVWLVPLVAALVGLAMLAQTWMTQGPMINITFRTAAGLEEGKTLVKYKDVNVGTVTAIGLSEDGSGVVATVLLDKDAASLARQDSRFWVVRPRIGIDGVSGVDTLLSGAYIGVDRGHSTEPAKEFTGLESPPTVVGDTPGRSFVLHTEDLGSLDVGSPVYYRRIQVGRVASYQLGEDGKAVALQLFVNAPYDRFVTTATRFWNASGVDVSLGADGFKLQTQSIATILAGGVSFGTAPGASGEPAAEETAYELAKDRQAALAPPDGPSQTAYLVFEQSLRGLAIGAPVQFDGMDLGKVISIKPDYDPVGRRFQSKVGIVVYPQRLGEIMAKMPVSEGTEEDRLVRMLQEMVAHGLRAQARTGSLLTGQLYIALDFIPNTPKVAFDPQRRPITLPTVSGSFDQLQERFASIVGKIDKMPLDSIARNLDSSFANLNKALLQLNGQVLPQATQTLRQAQQTIGAAHGMLAEDATLRQDLGQALQEIQRAARSVRALTDLLSRYPEAVVRGRPKNATFEASAEPRASSMETSQR